MGSSLFKSPLRKDENAIDLPKILSPTATKNPKLPEIITPEDNQALTTPKKTENPVEMFCRNIKSIVWNSPRILEGTFYLVATAVTTVVVLVLSPIIYGLNKLGVINKGVFEAKDDVLSAVVTWGRGVANKYSGCGSLLDDGQKFTSMSDSKIQDNLDPLKWLGESLLSAFIYTFDWLRLKGTKNLINYSYNLDLSDQEFEALEQNHDVLRKMRVSADLAKGFIALIVLKKCSPNQAWKDLFRPLLVASTMSGANAVGGQWQENKSCLSLETGEQFIAGTANSLLFMSSMRAGASWWIKRGDGVKEQVSRSFKAQNATEFIDLLDSIPDLVTAVHKARTDLWDQESKKVKNVWLFLGHLLTTGSASMDAAELKSSGASQHLERQIDKDTLRKDFEKRWAKEKATDFDPELNTLIDDYTSILNLARTKTRACSSEKERKQISLYYHNELLQSVEKIFIAARIYYKEIIIDGKISLIITPISNDTDELIPAPTTFNQEAFDLLKNEQCKLIYSPYELLCNNSGGQFHYNNTHGRLVYLPHDSIRQLTKDLPLAHEIRHATRRQEFSLGIDSLFNGSIEGNNIIKNTTYENYISFSELETFPHDILYLLEKDINDTEVINSLRSSLFDAKDLVKKFRNLFFEKILPELDASPESIAIRQIGETRKWLVCKLQTEDNTTITDILSKEMVLKFLIEANIEPTVKNIAAAAKEIFYYRMYALTNYAVELVEHFYFLEKAALELVSELKKGNKDLEKIEQTKREIDLRRKNLASLVEKNSDFSKIPNNGLGPLLKDKTDISDQARSNVPAENIDERQRKLEIENAFDFYFLNNDLYALWEKIKHFPKDYILNFTKEFSPRMLGLINTIKNEARQQSKLNFSKQIEAQKSAYKALFNYLYFKCNERKGIVNLQALQDYRESISTSWAELYQEQDLATIYTTLINETNERITEDRKRQKDESDKDGISSDDLVSPLDKNIFLGKCREVDRLLCKIIEPYIKRDIDEGVPLTIDELKEFEELVSRLALIRKNVSAEKNTTRQLYKDEEEVRLEIEKAKRIQNNQAESIEFRDEHKIISPDSQEGKEFQRQITDLIRQIVEANKGKGEKDEYAEYILRHIEDGTFRFWLADSDDPNGCCLKFAKPPIIIISKALFKKFTATNKKNESREFPALIDSKEKLAFVILHEITHSLIPGLKNSKPQEALCDQIPLRMLARAGFCVKEIQVLVERMNEIQEFIGDPRPFQVFDSHIIPENRIKLAQATLAELDQNAEVKSVEKTNLSDEIINIINNAHYITIFRSRLNQINNYVQLSKSEKIRVLGQLLTQVNSETLSNYFMELTSELQALVEIETNDPNIEEQVHIFADIFYDKVCQCEEFQSAYRTVIKNTLSYLINGRPSKIQIQRDLRTSLRTTPLGRLRTLSHYMQDFIDATNTKDEITILNAAENLSQFYLQENLTQVPSGHPLLLGINLPYFKLPEGIETYIATGHQLPWDTLQKLKNISAIRNCIMIFGLFEDPNFSLSTEEIIQAELINRDSKVKSAGIDTCYQSQYLCFESRGPIRLLLYTLNGICLGKADTGSEIYPPDSYPSNFVISYKRSLEILESLDALSKEEPSETSKKLIKDLTYVLKTISLWPFDSFIFDLISKEKGKENCIFCVNLLKSDWKLFYKINEQYFTSSKERIFQLLEFLKDKINSNDLKESLSAKLLLKYIFVNINILPITINENTDLEFFISNFKDFLRQLKYSNINEEDYLYACTHIILALNYEQGLFKNNFGSFEELLEDTSFKNFLATSWSEWEQCLLSKEKGTKGLLLLVAANLIRANSEISHKQAISLFGLLKTSPKASGLLLQESAICLYLDTKEEVARNLVIDFSDETLEEVIADFLTLEEAKYLTVENQRKFLYRIEPELSAMPNNKEKLELIEKLLRFFVYNNDYRTILVKMFCSTAKSIFGIDNTVESYEKELIEVLENINERTNKMQKVELLAELAKELEFQDGLTNYLLNQESKQRNELLVNPNFFTNTSLDLFILLVSQDEAAGQAFMEFLLSPSELKDKEKLLTELDKIKQRKEEDSIMSQIRKLELGEEMQRHVEQWFAGKTLLELVRKYKLDRALDELHENYWTLKLKLRAVWMREFLVPELHPTEEQWQQKLDFVINEILGNSDEAEHFRRDFAIYFKNEDDLSKPYVLSALLVAANPYHEGEHDIGSILAAVCEAKGGAEIKLAQAASGNTKVKKEIRKKLERLTSHADEPGRVDLIRDFGEIKEDFINNYNSQLTKARKAKVSDLDPLSRVYVKRVGKVLGSASISITFEVFMSDGQRVILSMKRDNVYQKALKEFQMLAQCVADLPADNSYKALMTDLIAQAQERLKLEVDMSKAKAQFETAEGFYRRMQIKIGENPYFCGVPKVLGSGENYYYMSPAKGVHFNELPENTDKQRRYKKEVAIAILLVEFHNILNCKFDSDRQVGNVLIDRAFLDFIDFKAFRLDTWSKEDYEQFAKVVSSLKDANSIDDIISKLTQAIEELKSKSLNVSPLVSEALKALISLGAYTEYVSNDELKSIVETVVKNGIHPEIEKELFKDTFIYAAKLIYLKLPKIFRRAKDSIVSLKFRGEK